MDSTEARIRTREFAIRLLNDLTTWIAAGSLVALGVFSAVAAFTIPGKASSGQAPATSSPAAPSPPASTSVFPSRHQHDSSTISASSGPPMVATGASR
jgi:hypothetical protein